MTTIKLNDEIFKELHILKNPNGTESEATIKQRQLLTSV